MEKNTGSGALPRNKGLSLSRGEYIQFLNADDMLTKTALEELYGLAKKYDADVVYCEKHYEADEDGTNIRVKSNQKGGFVDKPTLEPNDFEKKVRGIMGDRYLTEPWNKLVKRNLIITNEIFFPAVKISEDNVWNQGVLFCAKKFLRVPNLVYIQRMSDNSMIRLGRTAEQKINFWLNPVLLGLKALDKMMGRHEFFKENFSARYALLKKFLDTRFSWTAGSAKRLSEEVIYSAIKSEFGEKLGEYDVLIPALCVAVYNEKKIHDDDAEIIRKLNIPNTAKILVRMDKEDAKNFQLLFVSDSKAKIARPEWWQKTGVCYMIDSYAGKLEIVVQAIVSGKVQIHLKGPYVTNPEDKSKLIPYWIDFNKLIVNGKIVFNMPAVVWNSKPYIYNMDVKAGEEIKIETEWLPHRADNIENVPAVINPPSPSIVPKLTKAQEKELDLISIIQKDYFTARADIQLVTKQKGEFQIISVLDEKAEIRKPAWFQKNGIGYQIQSYSGRLEFVAKASVDGKINLRLRGLDVRTPEDKTKRIPYWINYTRLIVDEEVIFDEITPAWLEKFYSYNTDIKAGEEIKIQIEWLPHGNN